MSIFKTIKESDKEKVLPGEEFKMTLEIWAESTLQNSDTVLILDTSGSMIENGIDEMKKAANAFLDAALKEGSSNRVSIVSFNDRAHIERELTHDKEALREAIDSLIPKGYTNHADAFKKAYEAISSSPNKKTAILFTDGDSTIKGDIEKERKKLVSIGCEIYTIALGTPLSVRMDRVRSWASNIKDEHFFLIYEKCRIEEVFKKIAEESLCRPSRNIDIDEHLMPGFVITRIKEPLKGEALMTGKGSLSWKIDELGRHHREGAKLCFYVKYTCCDFGIKKINKSITCIEDGREVTFPSPEIEIVKTPSHDNDFTEEENEPILVTASACRDSITVDGENLNISSQGRIVTVNVLLKNICPERKVALGVILSETDACQNEKELGVKTILIPPHHGEACRDIKVGCIKFAVPEESDTGLCRERSFSVRTIVNYIDTDYVICK